MHWVPDEGGIRSLQWMREVITGHPVPDEGGHQRSLEVIGGPQRSSEAIGGNQEAIGGHSRSFEVIRGHWRPSEVLRGTQCPLHRVLRKGNFAVDGDRSCGQELLHVTHAQELLRDTDWVVCSFGVDGRRVGSAKVYVAQPHHTREAGPPDEGGN